MISGKACGSTNITRDLLDNGILKHYIDEFSVTGLTSNPTIFEHAISKSKSYDAEIGRLVSKGLSGAVRVLTRVRKGERIVGQPRGSLPLCRHSVTNRPSMSARR